MPVKDRIVGLTRRSEMSMSRPVKNECTNHHQALVKEGCDGCATAGALPSALPECAQLRPMHTKRETSTLQHAVCKANETWFFRAHINMYKGEGKEAMVGELCFFVSIWAIPEQQDCSQSQFVVARARCQSMQRAWFLCSGRRHAMTSPLFHSSDSALLCSGSQ